ncbi:MAG: hypothetical protein HOP14_06100 [Acidobacteria bacterium]|nr:hypothetical protein [Acidobacteriota bacterium]
MRILPLITLVLTCTLAAAPTAYAQDRAVAAPDAPAREADAPEAPEAPEASEVEAPPLFHAAVLLGDTHHADLNGLTLGGDLEVRLTSAVGIGVTGEHVNEPFRENIWVFPVIVHPKAGLKLTIGAGFEREHPEGADHHVEQHGLLRLGAGYDIPLPHGWTLGPDLAVDFVAGQHVVVWAAAVGKEFGPRHGHRPASSRH